MNHQYIFDILFLIRSYIPIIFYLLHPAQKQTLNTQQHIHQKRKHEILNRPPRSHSITHIRPSFSTINRTSSATCGYNLLLLPLQRPTRSGRQDQIWQIVYGGISHRGRPLRRNLPICPLKLTPRLVQRHSTSLVWTNYCKRRGLRRGLGNRNKLWSLVSCTYIHIILSSDTILINSLAGRHQRRLRDRRFRARRRQESHHHRQLDWRLDCLRLVPCCATALQHSQLFAQRDDSRYLREGESGCWGCAAVGYCYLYRNRFFLITPWDGGASLSIIMVMILWSA